MKPDNSAAGPKEPGKKRRSPTDSIDVNGMLGGDMSATGSFDLRDDYLHPSMFRPQHSPEFRWPASPLFRSAHSPAGCILSDNSYIGSETLLPLRQSRAWQNP